MKLYQELKINEATSKKEMTVKQFIDIAFNNINKGIVAGDAQKYIDILDVVCHSSDVKINIEEFDELINRIQNGEDEYVVMRGEKYDPTITVVKEGIGVVEVKKSEYNSLQQNVQQDEVLESNESISNVNANERVVANAVSQESEKLRNLQHQLRLQNDPAYRNAFTNNPALQYLRNQNNTAFQPQNNFSMMMPFQSQYNNISMFQYDVQQDNDDYTDDIILSNDDVDYVYHDLLSDSDFINAIAELKNVPFNVLNDYKGIITSIVNNGYEKFSKTNKKLCYIIYNIFTNNAYIYRTVKTAMDKALDNPEAFTFINNLINDINIKFEDEISSEFEDIENSVDVKATLNVFKDISKDSKEPIIDKDIIMKAIAGESILDNTTNNIETYDEYVARLYGDFDSIPEDSKETIKQEYENYVNDIKMNNNTKNNEPDDIETYDEYVARLYSDFDLDSIPENTKETIKQEYENYVNDIKMNNKTKNNGSKSILGDNVLEKLVEANKNDSLLDKKEKKSGKKSNKKKK